MSASPKNPPEWLRSVYVQLRVRDQEQCHPFGSLVTNYTTLQTNLGVAKAQLGVLAHEVDTLTSQVSELSATSFGPHRRPSVTASPRVDSPSAGEAVSAQTVAEMRMLITSLQAKVEAQTRDLVMMDDRVMNNEVLLMAREQRLSSLTQQLAQLQKDNELRQGYIDALETKLSMARNNAGEIEARDKRIVELEAQVCGLTSELAGVRSSVALGLGEGATDTLSWGAEDLERPSVAWHIKTAAMPPTACRFATQAHEGVAALAQYHPSGSAVITGGSDGMLRFFHARTGKKGVAVSAAQQPLLALSFDATGEHACFGGADKRVSVWRCMAPTPPRTMALPGECVGAGFLSGQRVVCASKARGDCLGLLQWGEEQDSPLSFVCKSTCDSAPVAMAVSDITATLATAHLDKSLRLWSVGSASLEQAWEAEDRHDQRITGVCFAPSARTVLTTAWDCHLKLSDVRTRAVSLDIVGSDCGFVNKQEYTKACFSPDERYIACGDNSGRVFVWDLRNTAKPFVSALAVPGTRAKNGGTAGQCAVLAVAWNPNGRQVCAVDRLGYLNLFEPLASAVPTA